MHWAALGLLVAFLCGSIPFGYLIVKWHTGKDIRQHGSGNIGSTNAARVLGAKWGYAVLILDIAKGAVGFNLGMRLAWMHFGEQAAWHQNSWPLMLGLLPLLAVLGHCYSPWLGWRGGKGVATMFGAMLPFMYGWTLVPAGVYLLLAKWRKAVSAGSIAAATAIPFAVAAKLHSELEGSPIEMSPMDTLLFSLRFSLPTSLVVLWRHKDNIKRLLAGTERRIGDQ